MTRLYLAEVPWQQKCCPGNCFPQKTRPQLSLLGLKMYLYHSHIQYEYAIHTILRGNFRSLNRMDTDLAMIFIIIIITDFIKLLKSEFSTNQWCEIQIYFYVFKRKSSAT